MGREGGGLGGRVGVGGWGGGVSGGGGGVGGLSGKPRQSAVMVVRSSGAEPKDERPRLTRFEWKVRWQLLWLMNVDLLECARFYHII